MLFTTLIESEDPSEALKHAQLMLDAYLEEHRLVRSIHRPSIGVLELVKDKTIPEGFRVRNMDMLWVAAQRPGMCVAMLEVFNAYKYADQITSGPAKTVFEVLYDIIGINFLLICAHPDWKVPESEVKINQTIQISLVDCMPGRGRI